jgi:hypothetical protein
MRRAKPLRRIERAIGAARWSMALASQENLTRKITRPRKQRSTRPRFAWFGGTSSNIGVAGSMYAGRPQPGPQPGPARGRRHPRPRAFLSKLLRQLEGLLGYNGARRNATDKAR